MPFEMGIGQAMPGMPGLGTAIQPKFNFVGGNVSPVSYAPANPPAPGYGNGSGGMFGQSNAPPPSAPGTTVPGTEGSGFGLANAVAQPQGVIGRALPASAGPAPMGGMQEAGTTFGYGR